MHAVVRNGLSGLLLILLAPLMLSGAVTAGLSEFAVAPASRFSHSAVNPTSADAIVGHPAPELVLPTLRPEDAPVSLAGHRGKIVFVDFWSSWCAPCRRAMPQLDALRSDHSRSDFEVIGVNVDPVAADAWRLLESLAIDYPLVRDSDGAAARRFGVSVLPALVMVDRQGVVRDVLEGAAATAEDELRARLAGLIEERDIR